jgi:hypothetical protein
MSWTGTSRLLVLVSWSPAASPAPASADMPRVSGARIHAGSDGVAGQAGAAGAAGTREPVAAPNAAIRNTPVTVIGSP